MTGENFLSSTCQVDFMSTSNESRRTLESDLFSSLFKSGGAESSSAHSYSNIMGEMTIVSRNNPFEKQQLHQTQQGFMDGGGGDWKVKQVDNDSTFTPRTMVVDAVYNASQRILGGSSNVKDNNGESEPQVMSATRKQWLQRINGGSTQQLSGVGVSSQMQASGAPCDKATEYIRRVKVITPDKDKVQTVDPLMRVDVRRLRAAKIGEDVVGLDPVPFESSDFVGSALLKPCFSPFQQGICAIATEEHPLQVGSTAYLIVAEIHRSPRPLLRKIAYMPLDVHPSALQWYTHSHTISHIKLTHLMHINTHTCTLTLARMWTLTSSTCVLPLFNSVWCMVG